MKSISRKFYSLLTISCFHFVWILTTVADKHPQGQPLGYYQPNQKVQSYYRKDPCPAPDPSLPISPDGTVTDPNENDGFPYYPCTYNFQGLEGMFFLANGTYFPCLEPRVVEVVRVGGHLPKGVVIRKAVHQSIAVKFPTTGVQAIPLVAALVTEGVILTTNTTTPYNWRNNLAFYRAKKKKIAMRRRDSKPFSATQVKLAETLYSTLTSLVDRAERHMLAINRDREDKMSLGPFIVANVHTFTTPTTRALESLEDLHPDFIEAERVFGLGGSRFEFEEPETLARKLAALVSSSTVPVVKLGNLGTNPQESSRNTLDTFNNIVELSKVAQRDISRLLSEETEEIIASSAFNFTYIRSVKSAYCDRDIEIDPRGHVIGGNVLSSVGMGMVTARLQ